MHVDDWLAAFGLHKQEHPFIANDEELHTTNERWLFDHPVFQNTLTPRGADRLHHVVVAQQGGGKTTLRKQLINHYDHQDAVVIVLTDWQKLEQQQPTTSKIILDLIIDTIIQQAALELGISLQLGDQSALPVERLELLVGQCRQYQRDCIIIIDKLDELTLNSNATLLVQPLIGNIQIHKIAGLTFKYIMVPELADTLTYRKDLIRRVAYVWRPEDLQRIIKSRLQSANAALDGLWSLAEPNLDNLDALISRIADPPTPRSILTMCVQLIEITANTIDLTHEPKGSFKIQVAHVDQLFDQLDIRQPAQAKTILSVQPVGKELAEEKVEQQNRLLGRLNVHRRTLAHLLDQEAQQGGKIYVLPAVTLVIEDARHDIGVLKNELQLLGATVESHFDDEPHS